MGFVCLGAGVAVALLARVTRASPDDDPEARVLALIQQAPLYALVPADLFERLGWELPDRGRHVKRLADAAPGGAFDPRALERLPTAALGYSATWHVVRYRYYGLDWDITGLLLTPRQPMADFPQHSRGSFATRSRGPHPRELAASRLRAPQRLKAGPARSRLAPPRSARAAGAPTVAFINGGSANWYEFFVDPLNNPAVGRATRKDSTVQRGEHRVGTQRPEHSLAPGGDHV